MKVKISKKQELTPPGHLLSALLLVGQEMVSVWGEGNALPLSTLVGHAQSRHFRNIIAVDAYGGTAKTMLPCPSIQSTYRPMLFSLN